MDNIITPRDRDEYARVCDIMLERELTSSVNFDKAILSLSSVSLGFSVSFLRDIVAARTMLASWSLYASWLLFGLAIVVTLSSHLVSQRNFKHEMRRAKAYYLGGDDGALKKRHWSGRTLSALDFISCASFVAAMCLTIFFAITNTRGKELGSDTMAGKGFTAELQDVDGGGKMTGGAVVVRPGTALRDSAANGAGATDQDAVTHDN